MTVYLIAACVYALAVTALLVVALYGNADLARELRSERRHERLLLDDLDFATHEAGLLRARNAVLEANVEQLGYLVLAVDAEATS